MKQLVFRNRQKPAALDLAFLRRIARHLLVEEWRLSEYQLGFHFVGREEMACVNETYLRHEGPTDVITFDHLEEPAPDQLHGEVFICVAVALAQARQFKTAWQAELVRYLIHSLLHLRGHDDQDPADRRIMKREENRLLKLISERFALSQVARKPKLAP